MSGLTIRVATLADARQISKLGQITFRETYETDYNVVQVNTYIDAVYSVDLIRRELEDENNLFLLSIEREAIVGFAKLSFDSDLVADSSVAAVELERIYFIERVIGRGYGRALLNACIIEARSRNCSELWLAVWEGNSRALKFYEANGFQKVGSRVFDFAGELQTDIVMSLAIA